MTKQQLKQQLHKEIDAIEDENALHMLNEAAVEYKRSKDKSSFLISRDFSDVEDAENADEIIREIAATAGKNAAAEAKAAGLPLTFIRNDEIIQVSADGKETTLQPIGSALPPFYVKYKPFTVFHARKK